jgi:hypothetical protein
MEATKQASRIPLLIGVLGIVLLLTGTLIYATLESGSKYQPELINQIAHDQIVNSSHQE